MKSKLLLFVLFLITTIGVVHSQVVDPNLVKTFMKFDGNLDDSSNNPVTYSLNEGSVTFAEGKFGQAGLFDAAVVQSAGLGFDPVESFTIATWINLTEVPTVRGQAHTWIHQLDGGAAPGRIHMEVTMIDRIGSFTNGVRLDDTTSTALANTWYHLAFVNNPAENTRTMYLDGVKKNEVEAGAESTNMEIYIGARKNLAVNHRAAGLMDELLITNQVLTEANINYIITNGVASAMQPSSVNDITAMNLRVYHWNGSLHAIFNSNLTNAEFAVYAITGQRVLDGVVNGNQLTIDAPLNKGVYILNVNAGNVPYNSKFIVK
jgi:hypothetical protein